MFGDAFGGGGSQRDSNKTDDVVHELGCGLADLYNGKVKKLAINRNVLCETCKGTGSNKPDAGKATCPSCNGRGSEVQLRRLGMSHTHGFLPLVSDTRIILDLGKMKVC